MREPLTVAVAQPECDAYDVAANAATHAAVVHAAGARVVVFPELSLTGYELDADVVPPEHEALSELLTACRDTGTLALAGAPVDGDGGPFIGMLAVDGLTGAVTVAYRKVYLGGHERRRFRPAAGPAVVTVEGRRLGLAQCKDTGVPRHQADTVALGIDAYLAGTCRSAEEADEQAERGARIAVAHGVWVAFASFAGPTGDGYTETAGRSAIWSPDGTPVARAGKDPGTFTVATIA
ncbi:carbon-nitrogen hydrolase family protein [Dactylosporangium sp. NPDC005555]|uniref:carbon-nitrogen hydrolase family protein n=1 Tax=Dactylosporangium sp. NPDC005555 TaxID=3154889 RepID=UPI0033A54DE8